MGLRFRVAGRHEDTHGGACLPALGRRTHRPGDVLLRSGAADAKARLETARGRTHVEWRNGRDSDPDALRNATRGCGPPPAGAAAGMGVECAGRTLGGILWTQARGFRECVSTETG